jgi:hypothetical protein
MRAWLCSTVVALGACGGVTAATTDGGLPDEGPPETGPVHQDAGADVSFDVGADVSVDTFVASEAWHGLARDDDDLRDRSGGLLRAVSEGPRDVHVDAADPPCSSRRPRARLTRST